MKIYLILFAIAVGLATTGCEGFLTEEPIFSQSDKLTLSTYKGLNQVTAGAYGPLASSSWYGVDFILLNEMKTSNGKKYLDTEFDTGRLNEYYNLVYTPTATSGVWGAAYYVISACNNVIANLEGKDVDGVTEQDLDNLKAECLFLRALSHFDLVRTFAQPYCFTADASHPGVPVILVPQAATDKPKRETVAKVYEAVLTDLLEAEEIIDPAYQRAGIKDNAAVVSLQAVQALLSRVYLYMENWAEAAAYATKVIDSKKYTMWTVEDLTEAAAYKEDVRDGGEVIFEVYTGPGESYGTGGNEGICSMTSNNKYGDAGASLDIVELYEEGDVRGGLFFSKKDGKTGQDVYWTTKYAGKGLASPDYSNVIVLRLSEMYLNRAEATIKGNLTGYDAVADLKVISDNRGSTLATATPAGVFEERQKELAWEAHLWFDLGRTKQGMTRNDFVGDPSAKTIEWGTTKWAMPIPARERLVNENLTQNEGY